jgi:hypothetical protein
MKKFFRNAAAAVTTMGLSALTFAQSTDGITAALDSVDLSGVSTKVGAAALLIVGIALVFKGPAIAKRVISKV